MKEIESHPLNAHGYVITKTILAHCTHFINDGFADLKKCQTPLWNLVNVTESPQYVLLGHPLRRKYRRKAEGFIMPPSEPKTVVIKIMQYSNKFTRELPEEAKIAAAHVLSPYVI